MSETLPQVTPQSLRALALHYRKLAAQLATTADLLEGNTSPTAGAVVPDGWQIDAGPRPQPLKVRTVPRADMFYEIIEEAGQPVNLQGLKKAAAQRGRTFTKADTITFYLRNDDRFKKVGRALWDIVRT